MPTYPESGTEDQPNNAQGDGAARIKVSQVGLDWPHKGELFLDTSGHQGKMQPADGLMSEGWI